MSQNPKRKAEDFDISMKHPGPAAVRPATGEPAMMPSPATLLRPALPPVSSAMPIPSAMRGSPALPYNQVLASSATRLTGPGIPLHGLIPVANGDGMTAEGLMMSLEKLKDELDEWQNSMSEQLNDYMGVITDMQGRLMQIKGQQPQGEQAAMGAAGPGNGEA